MQALNLKRVDSKASCASDESSMRGHVIASVLVLLTNVHEVQVRSTVGRQYEVYADIAIFY